MRTALFGPERFLDGRVNVTHTDNRQYRHQHLREHKGMICVHLGDHQTRVTLEDHAGIAQDIRGIPAYILAVGRVPAILRLQRQGSDAFNVLPVDTQSAVFGHLLHQPVSDGADGEDLFFTDAKNIIVKAGAIHDVTGRGGNVCRLIDDYRRVAGSGGNDLLAGLHGDLHHSFASGDT